MFFDELFYFLVCQNGHGSSLFLVSRFLLRENHNFFTTTKNDSQILKATFLRMLSTLSSPLKKLTVVLIDNISYNKMAYTLGIPMTLVERFLLNVAPR